MSAAAAPVQTRVRVAAVIVLRGDGAALMQHRDDIPGIRRPGMWVPPGGHAEEGESALDCARRELLEETAYAAAELHFLALLDDSEAGWPPCDLSIFWTRYDGVQRLECREGQALEFVGRPLADNLPIPPHLLAAWDGALRQAALS